MESCSARNHSLTALSLSDWIRSSVPCRVFSCRRDQSCQYVETLKAFRSSRRRLTSSTCFLLDLSLDAHSTEPPLRSTVNSGLF